MNPPEIKIVLHAELFLDGERVGVINTEGAFRMAPNVSLGSHELYHVNRTIYKSLRLMQVTEEKVNAKLAREHELEIRR